MPPRPTFPDGILYRPEIPVFIYSPSDAVTIHGLVDTGADETILPMSIAEDLAIPINDDVTSTASGFLGNPVDVLYGDVQFGVQIDEQGQLSTWTATVGFCEFPSPEREVVILGRSGFLDTMAATFVGEDHTLHILGRK